MAVAEQVVDRPRTGYPWRQFALLVISGWIGVLLVIPYQLALLGPRADLPPLPLLVLSGALNGAIEMALAVGVGLLAARAVGLRAPISEALAYRGDVARAVRESHLVRAVVLGLAGGVAIVILASTLFASVVFPSTTGSPGPFLGFMASFEGGITEEILLRLFVMAGVVWLLSRITRGPAVFWVANVVAAVLFGLGHLPATAALIEITPIVIARAVVLNGVVGVICGWLYWRSGLESAMVAHFSADIVLHVIAGV